jgi:hypothetical protein
VGTGLNRSDGWREAKNSAHALEVALAKVIENNLSAANWVSQECFQELRGKPVSVVADGKKAKRVPAIIDKKTTGKIDIEVGWDDKKYSDSPSARLSLKKCVEGQAFLIGVERFIAGFEAHYGVVIPASVKQSIRVFIGGDTKLISSLMAGKSYKGVIHRSGKLLEVHQKRISGETLRQHFPSDWDEMLDWFDENVAAITDFVFARGLALEDRDVATHIWYHIDNKKTKQNEINAIYSISQLIDEVSNDSEYVRRNNRDAKTVIVFPFGKLQMHQGQMQFRHDYNKVSSLCS